MKIDLRIDGATIFCEWIGQGRPCVCLHGGPGTDASGFARTLAPLAADLESAGSTCSASAGAGFSG